MTLRNHASQVRFWWPGSRGGDERGLAWHLGHRLSRAAAFRQRALSLLADRSAVGAIYKGLALATTAAGDRFYATDFHNGRVDAFDSSFTLVTSPGAFVDSKLPKGYAPFGIQTIGSRIFVTYAKQDKDAKDGLHGKGLGRVDVYDTSGALLERVAQHGQLDGSSSQPEHLRRRKEPKPSGRQ